MHAPWEKQKGLMYMNTELPLDNIDDIMWCYENKGNIFQEGKATALKSNINIFILPVVFFIHSDSVGMRCWILELLAKDIFFSSKKYSETRWHFICLTTQNEDAYGSEVNYNLEDGTINVYTLFCHEHEPVIKSRCTFLTAQQWGVNIKSTIP